MKYKFETKDEFKAKQMLAYSDNYSLLWELAHNFHRQFEPGNHKAPKHVDENSFYVGVSFVLDKLSEHLQDFKDLEP